MAWHRIIDEYLRSVAGDGLRIIEEHERGSEILAWLAAGIAFTTRVINLVVTIIKARSEGIQRGDHPSAPVILIVREAGREFNDTAHTNCSR